MTIFLTILSVFIVCAIVFAIFITYDTQHYNNCPPSYSKKELETRIDFYMKRINRNVSYSSYDMFEADCDMLDYYKQELKKIWQKLNYPEN